MALPNKARGKFSLVDPWEELSLPHNKISLNLTQQLFQWKSSQRTKKMEEDSGLTSYIRLVLTCCLEPGI